MGLSLAQEKVGNGRRLNIKRAIGVLLLTGALGSWIVALVDVGKSVAKALEEWTAGDVESAMMHACNAVDGTASQLPGPDGSNLRFTSFLRDNYSIFGPMAAPGINLETTRFPVRVQRPKAAGGQPDIADVIYGVHRCYHGHGQALPEGFDLLPDAAGVLPLTRIHVECGRVQLSDRTIFGLLAVVVASPVNVGQKVPDGYYLTFDGRHRMIINEWWGRTEDMIAIVATVQLPSVHLDFTDWMDDPNRPVL